DQAQEQRGRDRPGSGGGAGPGRRSGRGARGESVRSTELDGGTASLERIAELRAGQRAGAAGQRRTGHGLPLSPAASEGQGPHRAAALLLKGRRGGHLGGGGTRV